MPRLSYEVRARIMNMWKAKFSEKEIVERLVEGVKASRTSIYNLVSKFQRTNSIADITRRPCLRRLNEEHYRFVDEVMAENNDLSSRQLYTVFKTAYPSTEASLSTIKRACHEKVVQEHLHVSDSQLKLVETSVSSQGQVQDHLLFCEYRKYRRLWLISACAYSSKWKGNMRLIKNMRLYT